MKLFKIILDTLSIVVLILGLYLLAYDDVHQVEFSNMSKMEIRNIDILTISWFFFLILSLVWLSYRISQAELYRKTLKGYLLESPEKFNHKVYWGSVIIFLIPIIIIYHLIKFTVWGK